MYTVIGYLAIVISTILVAIFSCLNFNKKMKVQLKILDTDKFFYDSPNAGEPSCLCSRCGKQIPEGEKILRVAVGADDIKTGTGQTVEDAAHGSEFRLCETCLKNISHK